MIDKHKGENVLISKVPMISSDLPFTLEWLQFPVCLAFAVTINKAKEQSLHVVGLNQVNNIIQVKIPGAITEYKFIDIVMEDDQAVNYPAKFLNSLEQSAISQHAFPNWHWKMAHQESDGEFPPSLLLDSNFLSLCFAL